MKKIQTATLFFNAHLFFAHRASLCAMESAHIRPSCAKSAARPPKKCAIYLPDASYEPQIGLVLHKHAECVQKAKMS